MKIVTLKPITEYNYIMQSKFKQNIYGSIKEMFTSVEELERNIQRRISSKIKIYTHIWFLYRSNQTLIHNLIL